TGRVLPGRKNIVITRNKDLKIEGVEVYHSVEEMKKNVSEETVYIIGGAEIYRQTLDHTDIIYRTLIHHQFEADTFFPAIDAQKFELVWEEAHQKDEKNAYDYTFQKFVRKQG